VSIWHDELVSCGELVSLLSIPGCMMYNVWNLKSIWQFKQYNGVLVILMNVVNCLLDHLSNAKLKGITYNLYLPVEGMEEPRIRLVKFKIKNQKAVVIWLKN
jgi:hypothetical protein